MTDDSRDGIWALVVAALLLGIALLIVFVIHPGASHGQVGWYAGLLPGSIVGAILTGAVGSYLPRAQSIVYLLSLLVASFLWYVAMAFVIVKVVRAVAFGERCKVPSCCQAVSDRRRVEVRGLSRSGESG